MKVNIDLLKDLYKINHPSKWEQDMVSFILTYCNNHIDNLKIEVDSYFNLFITKSNGNSDSYPCIIAHMDSVHDFPKERPREILECDEIIIAEYADSHIQCGLGADDSNGILVALQLLEELPNLKVCFTTEEEIGGIGAMFACENESFFENVCYCIQADRRGCQDIICHTNGVDITSSEFLIDISQLMTTYDYSVNRGVFTDVGIIAPIVGVSGINVSCGYLNEHTDSEFCFIPGLENCLNLIYDIITTIGCKTYIMDQFENYEHYENGTPETSY